MVRVYNVIYICILGCRHNIVLLLYYICNCTVIILPCHRYVCYSISQFNRVYCHHNLVAEEEVR